MKEIIAKLSSYNLFNYLLPGVLLAVLAGETTDYSFTHENIAIGAFLYYFIGLVISRFGSLVIEPILKKVSFVKFAPYGDFIAASKEDDELEILSEANNMYRTLSSMFILLFVLRLYGKVEGNIPVLKDWNTGILMGLLLLMFLLSYRKQTEYIRKRVAAKGREPRSS